MGRTRSVVALALALASAAVVLASARRSTDGPSQGQIDQVAAELDARLREAAAGATSRAQTLADLPRLALAVATDGATVRDLTQDELAFRPKANETIEIAQLKKSGGPPLSLLRIPAGSTVQVPLASAGIHLIKAGDALRVASVVKLEPRARADELTGVVAVSWMADLGQVTALLAPLGGGVRLESPAGPIEIGTSLVADRPTVTMMLGNGVSQDVQLVVPAPASHGWNPILVVVALVLAGAGIAVSAWLGRRSSDDVRAASDPGSSAAGKPGGPRSRRLAEPTMPPIAPLRSRSATAAPPGYQIGRYTVLDRLGSGGMADVFLARVEGEAGFERLVALKVMHDDLVSNPKFVSHFLDEARLAPRLNHPNIVAITDLGRAGEKYVIAMEYVEGADLERLVLAAMQRQATIPVRVGLAIVRHICDGLHYAHRAVDGDGQPLALVHRDVKSANVFVARNGAVKVGDFGIAKIAGPTRAARTEIGEVKGTAAYMAPEHRLGHDIDARADVYAVGAICYELLTGRQINLDLAMIAHLGKTGWPHLPAPSALRPELPVELDAVVFRAMAYDRADRYPSCEALDQALADIVERHALAASDKVIAHWVEGELKLLPALPRNSAAADAV